MLAVGVRVMVRWYGVKVVRVGVRVMVRVRWEVYGGMVVRWEG